MSEQTAMSAEPIARVTDDEIRRMWRAVGGGFHGPRVEHAYMEEAKFLPFMRVLVTADFMLGDERTAHRATEAKLQAALAEVERLTKALDMAVADINRGAEQSDRLFNRATAAESALAATKAKLEAAGKVIGWVESWVANPVSVYSVAALDGMFAMTRDRIAALTTQEKTDDAARS